MMEVCFPCVGAFLGVTYRLPTTSTQARQRREAVVDAVSPRMAWNWQNFLGEVWATRKTFTMRP